MRRYGRNPKKSSVLGVDSTEWKALVLDRPNTLARNNSGKVKRAYRRKDSSTAQREAPTSPSEHQPMPTPQSNIASRVRSRRRQHSDETEASSHPNTTNSSRTTSSLSHLPASTSDSPPRQDVEDRDLFDTDIGRDRRSRRRQRKQTSTLAQQFGPQQPSRREKDKSPPFAVPKRPGPNPTPPRDDDGHSERGDDDEHVSNQQPNELFESPRSFRTRSQFESLSLNNHERAGPKPPEQIPKDCLKKNTRKRRKEKKKCGSSEKGNSLTLDDIMDETIDPDEEFYHPDYIMHEAVLPTESGFQQANAMDEDDGGGGYVPSWARTKSPRKRAHSEIEEQRSPSLRESSNSQEDIGQSPRKRRKPVPSQSLTSGLMRRSSSLKSDDVDVGPKMRLPCDQTGLLWQTPEASIAKQRAFRLSQRSHSSLLAEVLLKQESEQLTKLQEEVPPLTLPIGECFPCVFAPRRTRRKAVSIKFDGSYYAGALSPQQAGLIMDLLRNGANVNYTTADNTPVLFLLVHYSNVACLVKEMITRGADCTVKCTTNYAVSILDVALRVGDIATVKYLLKNGALPTTHSMAEEPCRNLLSFAKVHGFEDMAFECLRDGFFRSVEDLDFTFCEGILAHGFHVDTLRDDQSRRTALYVVAIQEFDIEQKGDHLRMIELLLSHEANPNKADDIGTPMICYLLTRARAGYETEIMRLLLEHGADPRVQADETGRTLLQYAHDYAVKREECCALLQKYI